jgi:hypothetical protein
MAVVIGVAFGRVIGSGGLFAQDHGVLRLLVLLSVLGNLSALLMLLCLVRWRRLRTAGYTVDHEILLTLLLSSRETKILILSVKLNLYS